ncbi:MAG: cytochrome P450 [Nannocystaceae bacterium]|nr:cytochrome P450 [Myxococcales bacterium]
MEAAATTDVPRRSPPTSRRGPRGAIRTSLSLARDPLGFFTRLARDYGDVVPFRFAGMPGLLLVHPDDIEEVIVRKASSFGRDWYTRDLQMIFGKGLLTSDGELWRTQRKLAAPPLARRQIESYAATMSAFADEYARGLADGERRDLHDDLMEVTAKIVMRCLFGEDYDEGGREVSDAIQVLVRYYQNPVFTLARLAVGQRLSVPRGFRKARDRVRALIEGVIERRSHAADPGDDLVSRLLHARDEDGSAMVRDLMRDDAITLFVAGHETTALALGYAFWLLARDPAALARLRAELDAVLGDRPPTAADVGRLRYCEAVILESMRLYPPAWTTGREALVDTEIGGLPIPRGTQIWMVMWVNHRDARWFPDPLRFDPNRWLSGATAKLPKYAYYPFGGGPVVCIGKHFAMMEAVLALAAIARQVDFEPLRREPLALIPGVTLRPRSGIPVQVRRR